MKLVLFLSLICIISLLSFSQAQDYPAPQDKYVNDFSNVLTTGQQDELRGLFSFVEENTTAEVVFVSIESASPLGLDQYAFELASNWKVGKEDTDNGILILYSRSENRIWVTVGYGIEGILPDSRLGRLLDEYYVPLRDQGRVADGIVLFSQVLSLELIDNADEIRSAGSRTNSIMANILFIIVMISIFYLVLFALRKSGVRPIWIFPLFLPQGRSHSTSHGGFGGGFGGGSFGGGGAGR